MQFCCTIGNGKTPHVMLAGEGAKKCFSMGFKGKSLQKSQKKTGLSGRKRKNISRLLILKIMIQLAC